MKYLLAILSDDVVFYNLLSVLISREQIDAEIHRCESYAEINERIKQKKSDLILIDGGLSFTSSFEIIQYLRNNKHIVCPIWYFAEIRTDDHIQKSLELGVSMIYKKPFDPYFITKEISTFFQAKLQT